MKLLEDLERILLAAKRKVEADDAIFLAGTGKIAADFAALGQEAKAADYELQQAVRSLTAVGDLQNYSDVLGDLVRRRQWIKCSDKLPEPGRYAVIYKTNGANVGRFIGDYVCDDLGSRWAHGLNNTEITHYCEIPPIPEDAI